MPAEKRNQAGQKEEKANPRRGRRRTTAFSQLRLPRSTVSPGRHVSLFLSFHPPREKKEKDLLIAFRIGIRGGTVLHRGHEKKTSKGR